MYQKIKSHPSTLKVYADKLINENILSKEDFIIFNIPNYEKDINKDYLDKISNAYLKYLNNRPELNVVFVDVSDLDFIEKDEDYLKLLFRIKQKLR